MIYTIDRVLRRFSALWCSRYINCNKRYLTICFATKVVETVGWNKANIISILQLFHFHFGLKVGNLSLLPPPPPPSRFQCCTEMKQVKHLTLMMTSAQVVETSVTVTDNSPFQDYPHPDDHPTRSSVTPVFKPFTVIVCGEEELYNRGKG